MKENYEENELKFKYVKTRHENCHDTMLLMITSPHWGCLISSSPIDK